MTTAARTKAARRNGIFCREHRTWFCPCAAPWMYDGKAASVAQAWFDPEHKNEPDEWDGEANPAELGWGDGAQGALW